MRSVIFRLVLLLVCIAPSWVSAQTIGSGPGVTSAGAISVALGGNGCGAAKPFASFPASPPLGTICHATNSSSCTAGTPLDGAGATFCSGIWNGSQWLPAGAATTAGTGGITAVTAGSPLASSGGATPNITATNPYPAANGGTGSSTIPTSGQIPVGNAGGTAYAPQTAGGDCTINSSGSFTCTKTNGVAFSSLATAGSPCNAAAGCTGTASPSPHGVALGEGSSAFNFVTLANDQLLAGVTNGEPAPMTFPDCTDTLGQHLNYSKATHLPSCGTSSSGGSAGAFTTINTVANTTTNLGGLVD